MQRRHAVARWLAVLAWVGVILGLSSIPDLGPPRFELPGVDKLAHLGIYGVLGVLWARAHRPRGTGSRRALALGGAAIALAVGLFDEWYQRHVPGRTADWRDALADVAGGGLGALAWWWLSARFRSRSRVGAGS